MDPVEPGASKAVKLDVFCCCRPARVADAVGPKVSFVAAWDASADFMDSSRIFVMGAEAPGRQISLEKGRHDWQALELVLPQFLLSVLAGHGVHERAPASAKLPGGQGSQLAAPLVFLRVLEAVPAGQSEHEGLVAFTAVLFDTYVPGPHSPLLPLPGT